MKYGSLTLLIHDKTEPLEPLRAALGSLAVDTFNVHDFEVAKELGSGGQPQMILVDTSLPEETWVSVLNLVERADVPLNIIVMGTHPHLERYLAAMGRGAFNLVVPPFVLEPMGYVIRSNAWREHARTEVAVPVALA